MTKKKHEVKSRGRCAEAEAETWRAFFPHNFFNCFNPTSSVELFLIFLMDALIDHLVNRDEDV